MSNCCYHGTLPHFSLRVDCLARIQSVNLFVDQVEIEELTVEGEDEKVKVEIYNLILESIPNPLIQFLLL